MTSGDTSPDTELVRAALPAYEIDGVIGRGGFGVVVGGRHRQLGRRVAVKQLPGAFSDDPHRRSRFLDEARLVAGLNHPHIVGVYDFVEHDGTYLLVMEHLAGGTLWDRFQGPGLMADESCAAVLATCAALHEAHGRGVLHRDVKPDNVMFDASGDVKLTDFGVSKILGQLSDPRDGSGEVVGTPAYMSPEQARGEVPGPAADVYSVGIMLYELLAGALPFPHARTPDDLMYQHVHEPPLPLLRAAPHLPDEFGEVMTRTLAKSPADRYPSAEAVGVALADAATAAYGTGWIRHGDIEVMAAPRIVQALAQRRDSPLRVPITSANADLGAVAPESRSLQRHDPAAETAAPDPHPAPAAPTVAAASAPSPAGAAPPSPPPSPQSSPRTSDPEPRVPAPAETPGRRTRRISRPAGIGLAVIAILAGLLAVVVLVGGDDRDEPLTASTAAGEIVDIDGEPVPAATVDDFLEACTTSGGTSPQCACVLEGLAAQLTVAQLEQGDFADVAVTDLEQDCGLSPR